MKAFSLDTLELGLMIVAAAIGAMAGYLGASFDGPAWRVFISLGLAAAAAAGVVHIWRTQHGGTA